ncbi:unnamed protein product [Mycena citricolor]|uniref:Uncharacterized protein n=1 Tax=Mycena citricolor TaxID=2018698 RepID=A0AAD2Q6D3_9AGAR|nr:unnamed protein product [Mycena citricolor]CAK5281231.1 unnamed protein product [Mycena citricolor]
MSQPPSPNASASSAPSPTHPREHLVTVDNVTLLVSSSSRMSFTTGRGANRKYIEINVSVAKSQDDPDADEVTVEASSTKVAAAGRIVVHTKKALDAHISLNASAPDFAAASVLARSANGTPNARSEARRAHPSDEDSEPTVKKEEDDEARPNARAAKRRRGDITAETDARGVKEEGGVDDEHGPSTRRAKRVKREHTLRAVASQSTVASQSALNDGRPRGRYPVDFNLEIPRQYITWIDGDPILCGRAPYRRGQPNYFLAGQ